MRLKNSLYRPLKIIFTALCDYDAVTIVDRRTDKMKKNDKTPKTKTTDSERETRVLLEDIRQQVKIVAEGHGTIIKKLEDHDKKFEQIDQRFDRIETVLTDTNVRVKSIEKSTIITKARIAKVEEKVFV